MGLRAIMVCVDYSDLLAVTLPYNRHHFEDVMVVTSHSDRATQDVAVQNDAKLFMTSAFYRDGAKFNKWRALEEGLDAFGRRGWLCLMDADVLWPKQLRVAQAPDHYMLQLWVGDRAKWVGNAMMGLHPGSLCTPLRRMAPWPLARLHFNHTIACAPAEELWHVYPVHRNVGEWAGYSQIFHASDPALGPAPWHEVDWEHAGGADSLFQRKWSAARKVRPPFEVLHLGEPGRNWYGRATPMGDGSVPADADAKLAACDAIWARRRAIRQAGGDEAATFAPEKLKP